jgi:hypothetical protein
MAPPDLSRRSFSVEENKFRDVLLDELEIWIAAQMRNIVHRTGDEIVNADDFVPAGNEQIREMRAKKAGGTGHDGDGLFLLHK